jgi:hypothetical protein
MISKIIIKNSKGEIIIRRKVMTCAKKDDKNEKNEK